MKTTFGIVVAAAVMMFGAGFANAEVSHNVAGIHHAHASHVKTVSYHKHHPKHCWMKHGHKYCK